jgi:hypothetical protein
MQWVIMFIGLIIGWKCDESFSGAVTGVSHC